MTINEKTLKYLAELARIELDTEKEGKLLKDLQQILDYFEELKEIDTEKIDPVRNKPPQAAVAVSKTGRISNGVEPMAGGTSEMNVFREDKTDSERLKTSDKLIDQFPEKENGFLKVPPVFE
ncbi:Asp-tRNA(Asn)/Glu-tRNA(Gln) amidotransferase subunit GatC [Candidatus Wolfebacteria bacterium]|nr:Asp-tRNA(Asn)/Glu-tRNA(Gln) amidotransferase subunit GatC [Candidatus Wolfebacteria bacterium]